VEAVGKKVNIHVLHEGTLGVDSIVVLSVNSVASPYNEETHRGEADHRLHRLIALPFDQEERHLLRYGSARLTPPLV